jgi:hypothetical protein
MRFPAYFDGDLWPVAKQEVDDHIHSCATCRDEFQAVGDLFSDCQTVFTSVQPTYTFDSLRMRMAQVRTLDEVAAFLPKLRINHTIPRLTVAALFLLLFMLSNVPVRHLRTMYHAMQRPFSARAEQWKPEYQDQLDLQYREQFAAITAPTTPVVPVVPEAPAVTKHGKNSGAKWA